MTPSVCALPQPRNGLERSPDGPFPILARGRRGRSFGRSFRQAHAQGDAPALQVHLQHPDFYPLVHLDHLVRIPDKAIGQLADVDQTVLVDADVDKGAEVDHVQDCARQCHLGFEVF